MRPRINWLTTDTHFFHKRLCQLCNRPEDFTEKLIHWFKYYICPQDNLIHLGDVIFNDDKKLKSVLDSFPGRKILIRGNHDKHSLSWYERNGFTFACDSLVIGKVFLSHHPTKSLPDGCLYNIHGHFHNNPDIYWEKRFKSFYDTKVHHLLKVEHHYKPINLEKFVSSIERKNKNEF